MSLYDFRPRSVRSILKMNAPCKWSYWTNRRSRLFRRQIAAARYSVRIHAHYAPVEEEESSYAR